jgi:hypothetical protein
MGGPFPGLEYTVGEVGARPHQSKGQEKYCSPPEAVHESAGTRRRIPRPGQFLARLGCLRGVP